MRAGARDFAGAEARPTRRRVLRIIAAVAGLPLMIMVATADLPPLPGTVAWRTQEEPGRCYRGSVDPSLILTADRAGVNCPQEQGHG